MHLNQVFASAAVGAVVLTSSVGCSGPAEQPLAEWTATVMEPALLDLADTAGSAQEAVAAGGGVERACADLAAAVDRARTAPRPADAMATEAWLTAVATGAELVEFCRSGDDASFEAAVPVLSVQLEEVWLVSRGAGG